MVPRVWIIGGLCDEIRGENDIAKHRIENTRFPEETGPME
jgi:hypothetical protein